MASSSHDHERPDRLGASTAEQAPNRRVDRAHRVARGGKDAADSQSRAAAQPSPSAGADDNLDLGAPVDDPIVALLGAGPHVNLQAEQLARLLADRLADIDRRETQLNLLAADLDNQQRTARLVLVERERELDRREAFIARLESATDEFDHQSAHERLDRYVRADTGEEAAASDVSEDVDERPVARGDDSVVSRSGDDIGADLAAALDERQLRLDAIRDTLIEEHRRLIDSRHTLEQWARRQREEIERRNAELTERTRSLERQAGEIQRWRVERTTCYEELQRLRRNERLRASSS